MSLVLIAVLVYWFNPPGNPAVDMAALIAIGFLENRSRGSVGV